MIEQLEHSLDNRPADLLGFAQVPLAFASSVDVVYKMVGIAYLIVWIGCALHRSYLLHTRKE